MFLIEIFLMAIGLSMDSLAVSVTSGSIIKQCKASQIFKISFVMGFFQAGMTAIGFFTGKSFAGYIYSFDHWIAFLLLTYIGGKMIYEDLKGSEENEESRYDPLNNKTICSLAIATSIDALAIGVSLALIKSTILIQAIIIGLVTFIFSAFGVYFGGKFGHKTNIRLELIGGLILITIGCKILIEHLLF